jgi:hypothetical protein
MSLASPGFLLLLIPWAGLIVYVLLGRRTVASVPFIELWRSVKAKPRIERTMRLPPLAVALLLLALLCAIIAASGPRIYAGLPHHRLLVIVDNGATMAPPGRLNALLTDAGRQLTSLYSSCDITLIKAVGDDVVRTDASDLTGLGSSIPAFPVDTSAAILGKIARYSHEQDAPIIVLSDRKLESGPRRAFQIAPQTSVANIGVVDLAVRDFPIGQAMLRLRNESALVEAGVSLRTAQSVIERKIVLPPPGETRDYFLDLPEVGPSLEVSLTAADEFAMDNMANVIRIGANPRIEIRGDVDSSVRRMVEVYTKHRPPADGSARIVVTDSLFQLPGERAVAVVSASANLQPLRGVLQVEMGHPVLREINWKSLDRGTVAASSPGDGWKPLVRAGNQVLLAVREQPFRQAWVGFASPEFEATRDFVIFWTNVLDYLGEGGASIQYQPLAPLSPGALPPGKPGIYQRPDGSQVAMNLVNVRFEANPAALTYLPDQLPATSRTGGLRLAPWLSLAAIICMMVSSLYFSARAKRGIDGTADHHS